MKAARVVTVSVAALAGFWIGWRLASRHRERHKAALFHPSRLRRLAALSHLAREESPHTVPLLRDYLAWESSAPLRRRAQRLVRRMQAEPG